MNASMEQEVQVMKDTAAKVQSDFTKPDDDWLGMAVFITQGGDVTLFPLVFSDDDEKEIIAKVVIPICIRQIEPWFVGQIQSAWTVTLPSDPNKTTEQVLRSYEELGIERPSQHPNREECLILVAVTLDQVQFWQAKIIRHPDRPPTLSEWNLWSSAPATGQFIDPIIATLKEVEDERNAEEGS